MPKHNPCAAARSGFLLFAAVAVTGFAARGEVLVVTRSGEAWKMQRGESIQINGKDKLRSLSSAAVTTAGPMDGKSVGKLAAISIDSSPVIRRTTSGEWVARAGAASEWQAILPEGLKLKTPESAAQMWQESAITLHADRKDKAGTSLPIAEIYAIVPARDSVDAAVWLASDLAAHKTAGVSDGDALRIQAALIPVAAATFPGTAVNTNLNSAVRSMIQARLTRWQEGDAELEILEQALLLTKASEQPFGKVSEFAALGKQVADAKRMLDRKVAIIRALDAGGQSDAFLFAYRDFESFDRSFQDLSAARRHHLTASAEAHLDAARGMRQKGDYAGAVRNLRIAQLRNPQSQEVSKFLEEVRLEVARITSQHLADARRGIDPRSPSQVQVQRRLSMAEQFVADSKYDEAEAAIKEAEGIDADEPRIRLLQARLAIARGELGVALAELDLYAGMALTTKDFAEGEKLRSEVQYKLERARSSMRSELKSLSSSDKFATALEKATTGLQLDNEEPSFLYQAGINACILRHCDGAAPFLRRFLELTDSTQSSRLDRMTAVRLLRATGSKSDPQFASAGKPASWLSGAPLEPGIFYDPVSLAFQPKVAHVNASDHLTIAYEWKGNMLNSVRAKYEDKKMAKNAGSLALGLGVTGAATWRTAERETNDFYFNYYDDVPQVLSVNHDNAVVKSRKIPIRVPSAAMMMAGGIGGMGALGGMGMMGQMGGLASMSPLGGMSAIGGMGSMRGLGALASAASGFGGGGSQYLNLAQSAAGLRQNLTAGTMSIHADPQGGSASGFLTLWNSPRVDTQLAQLATGKRVALSFSGNRYFHPFAWDGIHLFELDYDSAGRVAHAREAHTPTAPRLDFEWNGRRLLSVTGRQAETGAVVYKRTLTYQGDRLISEAITGGEKRARIEYKYDKLGRLIEANCDGDTTLDGRSRKVEFLAENSEKGAR